MCSRELSTTAATTTLQTATSMKIMNSTDKLNMYQMTAATATLSPFTTASLSSSTSSTTPLSKVYFVIELFDVTLNRCHLWGKLLVNVLLTIIILLKNGIQRLAMTATMLVNDINDVHRNQNNVQFHIKFDKSYENQCNGRPTKPLTMLPSHRYKQIEYGNAQEHQQYNATASIAITSSNNSYCLRSIDVRCTAKNSQKNSLSCSRYISQQNYWISETLPMSPSEIPCFLKWHHIKSVNGRNAIRSSQRSNINKNRRSTTTAPTTTHQQLVFLKIFWLLMLLVSVTALPPVIRIGEY